MRIGQVIGKLSLSREHSSIRGSRWLLTVPLDLASLSAGSVPAIEELVVIDELGATAGDRIGISEGGEAAFAYWPAKMPVDAYNACILDELVLNREATDPLLVGGS